MRYLLLLLPLAGIAFALVALRMLHQMHDATMDQIQKDHQMMEDLINSVWEKK